MSYLTVCAALAACGMASAGQGPALEEPGVVLTFDDMFVKEWVAALPLFAKYGAHATFFVTRFDELSGEQLEGLKQLKEAGHAIGCHSLRHRKAVEYSAEHGMEKYLADDIEPAVRLMKEAGFPPTSFAYPNSQNNAETDAALLKTFRHLRTGKAPAEGQRLAEFDAIFTPLAEVAERGCLPGRGIDRAGEEGREDVVVQVKEALDRAKARGECVVLYSHSIANEGRNHIAPKVLEEVLAHAKSIGLRFYTYDDLP